MKRIFTAFMMMLCAVCVASAANYLTFTAEEDSSTFGIINEGGNNPDVQYSLDDGETWIALAEGDTVVLVHKGDKALLKGVNPEGVSRDGQFSTFKMTGKVAASGSVMSLIDGTGLATEIPGYACFDRLFIGCTSLTQAPELSATTLAEGCYSYMFYGCTNLSEIRASFDEWERGTTYSWVRNVAPTGTFICPKALALEYGTDRIPEGWTVKYIDDTVAAEPNYLTFTAEEDGSTFGIVNVGNNPDAQYSLNGGETWNVLVEGDTIVLAHKGDKAYIRGYNEGGLGSDGRKNVHFVMTGAIVASGSVMSLIDGTGLSTEIPKENCFNSLFKGCASLTQAPELPATTLAKDCYEGMFSGCTNLTQAPALPAATLADFCYYEMFYGCTGLTQAPELPAMTLAEDCYAGLFSGCTSLTQAPALPATTLAYGCYASMFAGCTSLTKVSELPATTLTVYCYSAMFSGCTSLTQAPELPATTLADYCYNGMFSGCTSLTQAPELPVDSLARRCYYNMFSGCTSLSEINVSFTSWSNSGTEEWVKNVAPTGTFICPKALALEYGTDRIPEGWTVKYIDDTVAVETNYLTFTAEEDGSTFGIVNNGGNNPDIQYSLDGGETWTALAGGKMVTLAHKGDKALLRGSNPEGFSKSRDQYSTFRMTGKVAASGSVMSLIDGTGLSTEIPNGYCFCRSFRACTSLTRAPELPATTLTIFCYDAMFLGCTSLTQVPALPATTLADFCYDGMFARCTSLTQAPELPVTTLVSGCYYSMFSDCTSLTQAPALPATTLADSCYMYMFSGCTSLSEIHVSFDDWRNAGYSTAYWVENVAPSGTFICPENLPLEYGANRIPLGWRVKKVIDGDTVDVLPVNRGLLTFTAEEDGSTFGIVNNGKNNPDVQYSLDGGDIWIALAAGDTITLAHKGDKALLRGNNPEGFSRSRTQYSTFEMTGKVSASGSVMSLIDGVGKTLVVPASFCFHSLFEGCTSLTQAPELPATTLTENCYRAIFSGCTSLTQAPALPATTLAYSCYWEMFEGCTSLTQAPKLPATTLAEACYFGMFSSCTSLTQAPELPATTLAYSCYKKMFSSCDLLRQAPELPATTLVSACYQYMFSGCTSLTQAPELPAPELIAHSNVEISCYFGMFSECTNLSEISVAFVKWKDSTDRWEDNTYRWVENVAPTGTFICPKALPLEYGESRIPEGWTVKYIEDMANYLTFTAEEDGSTFGIVNEGENNPNVQYSLNGGETWNALAAGDTVTLAHKGDKALLRGDNPEGFSKSRDQYSTFRMTGKVAASGSVMSLIDGTGLSTEIPNGYCFCRSFRACTSLTRAPELPATKLARGCYESMFSGCTSLTQAPELPATTLVSACYQYMFSGCTSLTQAPELPATTLAEYCYAFMFSGCTSLTQAPELPAMTLAYGCYSCMFRGCTSLTEAPELPAMTLEGLCYDRMFSDCTSLTQAPELPATTLADFCYGDMFYGCTSLTQAPELPATTLAYGCYSCMFRGCTSLTEAPELPAMTLEGLCYDRMFSDCTSLTQAPELPAPELIAHSNPKTACYSEMFLGCTNLSEISVAFVEWGTCTYPTGENTYRWVENVAPTGTFICPKALALEYGEDRIPEGWTVRYIDDTVAVEANYLTFTAEEDGSTFGIVNEGNNPDVQYSLDGGETWTALAAGDTITLAHKGDKALVRGNNPEGFSKDYEIYSSFTMTGKIAASGSVMSLIDGVGLSTEITGKYCFVNLFSGCTGLTQAPELPATTLAEDCYSFMFAGCTSLTQAPELPATTLAYGCYGCIFAGCESLSQIRVSFDEWSDAFTGDWAVRVAPTGTFICPKTLPLEYGDGRIPEGWTVKYIDDTVAAETNYLTFTAEEDGSSFGIVSNEGNNPDVQYSLDGGKTWTTLAVKDAITLAHKGDKALLRGDNPDGFSRFLSPWTKYTSFTMTGKIAASGSVMSLIDGIGETLVIPNDICFYKLFFGCASLTQAPELPATTLAGSCYEGMFSGCTSLTQAPKLPATTLAKECYWEMFRGCTSLAQAPKLPATTLAGYCYCGMFDGCTGLTEAPELPVTTLAEWCYYGMFSGCTRLTQAPVLPANTLAGYCYNRMFQGCTSLTQAPELPATTLSGCCYSAMFRGCTNLTQAPELPATTLAGGCYSSMFSGCTSLAQAPELPATTMAFHCYEYMFYGCTSLTKAPELPATELPDSLFMRGGCCESMFSGCTNLSEISIAFDKWNDNTFEWVKDVAPTGTFICPKDLPLEYGVSRIPEGWTVKYIEGEGSGVNTTLANNITIWTDNLTIYIRGAEGEVSLYDMSGKRVATSNSKDEERALCVPAKGVYVVRTNNGTSDVLVR